MSGETIYKYAASIAIITGAASYASNGFNASTEVATVGSTQHSNYPLADAALFASFSTSVSSASNLVNLYRRDLNIDGTNDAPLPQSAAPAYSNYYVGTFIVPPTTAASSFYIPLTDIPLTAACEFYIENKTNATLISTFTVKMTPKTFTQAA